MKTMELGKMSEAATLERPAPWHNGGESAMRSHITPEERFWLKVDKSGECWLWTGARANTGYGQIWSGGSRTEGRLLYAHRWAYERLVGVIPDGFQIDHLCRNRACVNPAHLEPVTQQENILRGTSTSARHAVQTHCIHGHEFTPENTMRVKRPRRKGERLCRECNRLRARKARA